MKLWNKEQRVALGVSEKEYALIEILHRAGVLNTSVLAHTAKIPRVTTLRLLTNLKRRGFVGRVARGREVIWSLVQASLLEKRIAHLFGQEQLGSSRNIPLSEVGSLVVYQGAEALLESNRKILSAHPGERVLAIEPNGIWKHFSQVPALEWAHLNKMFKQKNILIELVTEEGFEDILARDVQSDVAESFLSLAKDVRVVRSGFLDSATEIMIFRDQILFTDWAHLVAVEIKNPSTVRVMRAMYRLLQDSGRERRHGTLT